MDIEKLIQRFEEHADKFDMQCKQSQTPNENFNLPRALALMCEEIRVLKDWYECEHECFE